MENIKIGEYVRTDNGEILKVLDTEKGSVKAKSLNCKEWFSLCGIKKHSKNIMDLIEYGDLVKFKGWKNAKTIDCIDMRTNEDISLVFADAEFCNGWTEIDDKPYMIYDLNYLIGKEQSNKIDWIITHEQINSNCYKVVE